MPALPLTDEECLRAVELMQDHKTKNDAAKAAGHDWHWIKRRIAEAERRNLIPDVNSKIEMPTFVEEGDEEEPIEEILSRQRKAFERKQKAAEARNWFPIKVNEEKSYGINWFGDPHLDDGGCNWPLLEKHIAICRQDGVYAGNIGDTTNNWPWTGRLAKLWSESEVSNKTAKRMAEWFMFSAGIKWLVWILGNHDAWNGGDEFYKRLGATYVPVLDWRAQFRLVHQNGSETRIDAAHGRKGNSIYNPSHGTLRDAKFGQEADLFVTGHIHSFKLDHYEIPERSKTTWLAQTRGYKWFDHYATVNGFAEYQTGASIFSVVDPSTGRVQCFADPEEGADYLKWKRR